MMPICIVLFVLVSFGCGGSNIIRTVQDDNIFYSSSKPKIKLKINPDFKFDKKTDQGDTGFSTGLGEKSVNSKTNKFLFVDRVSGKNRAVEIVIKELTSPKWFFKPNIFNPKNPFDSGIIKILGNNYHYCTYAIKKPNHYLLQKGTGRLIGANKNAMIVIFYLARVAGDWSNPDMLTAEQKRQLIEFTEDSKKDIQFIAY
ncbi:MAG: hypothetical protein MUP24_05780 [Gillisia sp.]|nr:hypothetical protein [Gillisia sp.]